MTYKLYWSAQPHFWFFKFLAGASFGFGPYGWPTSRRCANTADSTIANLWETRVSEPCPNKWMRDERAATTWFSNFHEESGTTIGRRHCPPEMFRAKRGCDFQFTRCDSGDEYQLKKLNSQLMIARRNRVSAHRGQTQTGYKEAQKWRDVFTSSL